ncbi:MAG: hypothetical protein IKF82_00640 [Bacilli bacterium]|nr:hypothetical protein [Bacilli bacterium]
MKIEGKFKYALIALIVSMLVFVAGAIIITSITNTIEDKHVDYLDVVVTDKKITNDSNHYYVIIDETGQAFDIINMSNSRKIYNHIEVGKEYRFVIKKPLSVNDTYIHIVQVYDAQN